jgi:uncharacterized protein (DUF2336 family)
MMPETRSLIAELDSALSKASSPKHLAILWCVTELFLNGAENYSNDQVAVFDDVIGRLIEKIELPALIELSARLAPVGNAPANVVGRLSCNDDIAVSGPVLDKSNVLTDETLVEIAKTKSQKHLSAIAGRTRISDSVTDVLVDRGNSDVARKVTANQGARLSEFGFVKLINRAGSDKALATAIADRPDMPPELQPFLKLALA